MSNQKISACIFFFFFFFDIRSFRYCCQGTNCPNEWIAWLYPFLSMYVFATYNFMCILKIVNHPFNSNFKFQISTTRIAHIIHSIRNEYSMVCSLPKRLVLVITDKNIWNAWAAANTYVKLQVKLTIKQDFLQLQLIYYLDHTHLLFKSSIDLKLPNQTFVKHYKCSTCWFLWHANKTKSYVCCPNLQLVGLP